MAVAIRQLTYAQAINEAMRLEMRRDPRVILMGEDVAGGAGVVNFESEDAWGGVLSTSSASASIRSSTRAPSCAICSAARQAVHWSSAR